MLGITTYTSLSGSRLTGNNTSAVGQTQAVVTDDKAGATTSTGTSSTVSNLARQLSEAATRAEARDASLSRKELGQKAATVVDQIVGDSYTAQKAKHDAEVPNTNDPTLLARAQQATDFVNGKASNPFGGMSQDQLTLIAYDESDTFTVNERRAAWQEAYDQEEAWRQKVVVKSIDEYNRTGKLTNFFTEVLEHYEGLPAIEQAQYPENYAADLQQKIDLDFNYMTHRAEGKGNSPTNLIEQLVTAGPYTNKGSTKPEAD